MNVPSEPPSGSRIAFRVHVAERLQLRAGLRAEPVSSRRVADQTPGLLPLLLALPQEELQHLARGRLLVGPRLRDVVPLGGVARAVVEREPHPPLLGGAHELEAM